MKNINKLEPNVAIVFKNENGEKMVLVQDETVVEIITDGTDWDKKYNGKITFVNKDGIEINNSQNGYSGIILWEYIREINILA